MHSEYKTVLQWILNHKYGGDVEKLARKSEVDREIISDLASEKIDKTQCKEKTLANLSKALELSPECFCKLIINDEGMGDLTYKSFCEDPLHIEVDSERLKCYKSPGYMLPYEWVGDFVSLDRKEYQKTHKKSPVCDRGFKGNTLVMRGRDGSFAEKELTDEQVKDWQTIVDQLPDAPDDL